MIGAIQYHFWRRLRAAYYAFGLARLPFGNELGRAISKWERSRGFGDSPKQKATWNVEYRDGRWAYMGQQRELARYWILIGFMDALRGRGEYLDVGCGDGVLFERFKALGYERYVGVDISDVAVAKLSRYNDHRTYFVQGDGDEYEPPGSFDVIIFNESLYYLNDPTRNAPASRKIAQAGWVRYRLMLHDVTEIACRLARREAKVRCG
jgi:SAM-dependent methyltransferase